MAHTKPLLARGLILGLALVASSLAAQPARDAEQARLSMAPSGTADTRYCMRVGPLTGSRLEQVECWTRAQWWAQGVDVDRDWPEEGVRTIG